MNSKLETRMSTRRNELDLEVIGRKPMLPPHKALESTDKKIIWARKVMRKLMVSHVKLA